MRARSAARHVLAVGLALALTGAGGVDSPPVVDAAKNQNWDRVRSLLEEGADVNAEYGDGTTALHWASYWNEAGAAELLIRAGADVNAANDLGATPLWPACQNGSAEMVRLLLEAGAEADAELVSGESLVMTASRSGNPEVVALLLRNGADPGGGATRGQTALMWAAAEDHPEVVGLLIEHGADVHARTEVRRQLMKADKDQDSHPDYQMWVEMGANTPLMFAAREGSAASAELLVEGGADVDYENAFGMSPIVLAVHGGNPEVVEYLLTAGADPDADGAGHTALHAAVIRGDEESARILLEHGADPEVRVTRDTPTRRQSNDFHFHKALIGATPFWLAARSKQPALMRLLAEHGADPMVVNDVTYPSGSSQAGDEYTITEEGPTTALMAAVGMGGHHNRALIDRNRGSPGFYLPPRHEREARTLEAVRVAVELGVDPMRANGNGRTALQHVRDLEYESVVEFLETRVGLDSPGSSDVQARADDLDGGSGR